MKSYTPEERTRAKRFFNLTEKLLYSRKALDRKDAAVELSKIIQGFDQSAAFVALFLNFAVTFAAKTHGKSKKQIIEICNQVLHMVDAEEAQSQRKEPVLDLSNDTEAEREILAQKVFAFINNPNAPKEEVDYVELHLSELKELFDSEPDWKKSKSLITALICEPNAYIYRETLTEIVSEQILDLSNYPQNGCLDLAKKVSDVICYSQDDGLANDALSIVTEMHDGLSIYTPEFIANLVCDESNAAYVLQLQDIFKGEK